MPAHVRAAGDDFLYRVASSERAGADRKILLSGFEVASRLSYALWNAMPSDALLAAAGAGELDSKDGVARWAERMLDDPRANEVLLAFHEQTFQTAAYGTQDKVPELASMPRRSRRPCAKRRAGCSHARRRPVRCSTTASPSG